MAKRQVPPYQKAIELLARRSHFRREIAAKLAQRGYEEDEVESTVERLADEGLIDDRETAREFVRGRLARRPMGRVRLQSELGARGVPSDLAGEVLGELYPDDDLDLARRAARGSGPASRRSPEALARRLDRLGFSSRAIVHLLREMDEDA